MLFSKVDPGRAAGGEYRALLFGEFAQEFGAFFHDHHVGAEVGVEDDVGTHLAQRGDDLAFDIGARWQAEFLAKADANRRGGLEDGDDFRVGQPVEDFLRLVALGHRAGRADHHALAAGDAGRQLDRAPFQAHPGVIAPAREFQRIDVLHLAADGDAALAADAAAAVINHRLGAAIRFKVFPAFGVTEADLFQADRVGCGQQFAIAVARAGSAVLMVIGHDHFHLQLAHFLHLRRARHDLPALGHRRVAGGDVLRLFLLVFLDFNEADAAGARRMVNVVQFTQGGDEHAIAACHVEDGLVCFEAEFFAVDLCFHGAHSIKMDSLWIGKCGCLSSFSVTTEYMR